MNAAIRTCLGTSFRTMLTMALEQVSTNSVASPITMAFCTVLVIASVGHIPSTCMKTGFCSQSPLRKASIPPSGV